MPLPLPMPSDLTPVVCALDLHSESEAALVAAVALAARAREPLHLVTVRPPSAPDAYHPPTAPDAAVQAVVEIYVDRALGAGACAELAPEVAVAYDTDAAGAVAGYADHVDAGVLVLGTHARRGLERFRLGSVAEALVRRAHWPVLVVPNASEGRMPGPSHPVLVPVDFSEPSAQALAAGAALARLTGAPLEVVHVMSLVDRVPRAYLDLSAPLGAPLVSPAEMDTALRAFTAPAEPAAFHVRCGDAPDEIVRLATERDAGAVAMGTHGRGGVGRALWGSVTEAALRRLPCPVLAVRARIDL